MTVKQIQKIIHDKVDGVWIPKHDEHGHHYLNTKDGRLVDSVTTQISLEKPQLKTWAARKAVEYFIERMNLYCPETAEQLIKEASLAHKSHLQDAGGVGTRAHEVIENYIKEWIATEEMPSDMVRFLDGNDDPRVWAAARSAEKIVKDKEIDFIPIATELLVGSTKIDAAGTLDLLVWYKGDIWIFDWKTSNSAIHDDYAMQVAAYKNFFEEMTGLKIKGCLIIQLSKDYDKYKKFKIPHMNWAYAAFKHQVGTQEWIRNGERKVVEDKVRLTIKL